jgi:hypothetical protein
LAQGAQPNPANPNVLSDISCNGEGTSKELKALATLVVSGEITEEVRRCSQALSDEGKAQLFEIIAVERGLSIDELHEEARRDREALETRRISGYSPLGFWQQLIELHWTALGYRVVSTQSWWGDSLCDGDPSDQDYLFYFVTPVPVNNPDGLRTFSQDTLVSAMLSWYQFWYGGVNGFGITGYNFVKICLGDGGVAAGGGPDHVAYWLKLLQP